MDVLGHFIFLFLSVVNTCVHTCALYAKKDIFDLGRWRVSEAAAGLNALNKKCGQ